MDAKKTVIPVGHFKGAFFPEAGAGPDYFIVRIGWGSAQLTPAEFYFWSKAHGGLPQKPGETVTAEQVLSDAEKDGVPADGLDALEQRGLIVGLDASNSAEIERFARASKLMPLMVGLGNTSEEPWIFNVGLPGRAIVHLDDALYELWSRSHLEKNLWAACEQLAADNLAVEVTDPQKTTPTALADHCVRSLHSLLVLSSAYIDVAVEPKEA